MDGIASRIHVATAAPISKPGGLHSVVRSLAASQANLGYNSGIVHTISGRGHAFQGDGRLLDQLGEGDAVLFHFAPTVREGLRLLPSGALRVFHFHGPWSLEGRAQGNSRARVMLKSLVERRAYARFESFVTASRSFADVLNGVYGVPATSISTINPGVDVSRFSPGSKFEARGRLNIRADARLVSCVRRLEPRMGISTLISAMEGIKDAELWIAGQGSLEHELRAQIERADLGARVRLLGRVSDEDLVDLYRASDVAVVPTVALEGFGVIVLEAMACGTPVVATSVDGLLEAMGPFADQWTCGPGEVARMADLVRDAFVDPPSSHELRDYALSHSAASAAMAFEELFSSLS